MSPATSSSSLGLYIPIHKRSPSSESSRTSESHGPEHPAVASHMYSVDFLLSLRPTADESVRDKLRASCPEIVMSRRIRKSIEFNGRQRLHRDVLTPRENHDQGREHIELGIHRVPVLPSQKQFHVPSVTLPSQSLQGRVLPRRSSRAAIRPAERRRQAWQPASAGAWRGLEPSPQSLVV